MERNFLASLDDIVEHFLPIEKMKKTYSDLNTAKNMILNRITFLVTNKVNSGIQTYRRSVQLLPFNIAKSWFLIRLTVASRHASEIFHFL